MSRRPPVAPLLVLVFGILAASTASIFIRNAQVYAPSLVIAALRLVIAALVLTPFVLTRRRAELRTFRGRERGLALLSGIFLALHFATWITSLEFTSVASSVVLVATTPLWVALLAPITIKEPLTRPILIGMTVALLGGVIVGLSDSCTWSGNGLVCPPLEDFIKGRAFLGDLLALAGALMAAGYLIIGRRLRAGTSLLTYIFVVYGMAAVALVVIMLAAGDTPFGYPPQAYFWILLTALIPQLLGHSSFNYALAYLSAAYVSISLLGEPIGSSILAYVFLDEKPGMLKIIGAILILTGIYLASRGQSGKPEPKASATNTTEV
jgi:drug/metabolite transporter (DMT)-like permease